MGNPNKFPLRGPSPELIPVPFRVKLDAANDGVVQEGNALIKSVKHTAAGKYRVLLKDQYKEIVSVTPAVGADIAVDLVAQVRTPVNALAAGGGYVDIELLTGVVATNPAAAGANQTYLFGVIWIRNTEVAS